MDLLHDPFNNAHAHIYVPCTLKEGVHTFGACNGPTYMADQSTTNAVGVEVMQIN